MFVSDEQNGGSIKFYDVLLALKGGRSARLIAREVRAKRIWIVEVEGVQGVQTWSAVGHEAVTSLAELAMRYEEELASEDILLSFNRQPPTSVH
jgi:hypothetical protein